MILSSYGSCVSCSGKAVSCPVWLTLALGMHHIAAISATSKRRSAKTVSIANSAKLLQGSMSSTSTASLLLTEYSTGTVSFTLKATGLEMNWPRVSRWQLPLRIPPN